MKSSIITNSRKLPKFITSHPIFTQIKTLNKIFPSIGLPNCIEPATPYFKPTGGAAIKNWLLRRFNTSSYWFANPTSISRIRRAIIACKDSEFQRLAVPKSLTKLVGTSYQRAWVNARCYTVGERSECFRRYKTLFTLPSVTKKTKIVFASADKEGAWDIATMSMRGISSCQSWRGGYSRDLIGSIVDPYVGIIYLTNGSKTTKGRRMTNRAVIRYVVHHTTRKPALMIEPVYSSYYDNEQKALGIFAAFLNTKTKLPIVFYNRDREYYIPNSKPVAKLQASNIRYHSSRNGDCVSYRDSGIRYSTSTNNYKHKIS